MSSCDCPRPPGGRVKCEDDQIAFCIVKDGEVTQQCITPISTSDSLMLINWTLSEITGDYRNSFSMISKEDISILKRRKYEAGGVRMTFGLPRTIRKALAEVIRNRNKGGGLSGMSGLEEVKV